MQPTNGKNAYIRISWNSFNWEKHFLSELGPFISAKEHDYVVINLSERDGAIRFALSCFVFNPRDMSTFALHHSVHMSVFAMHTIFQFWIWTFLPLYMSIFDIHLGL